MAEVREFDETKLPPEPVEQRMTRTAFRAVATGRRAARKCGAADISLTVEEWLRVCAGFGFSCAYCGYHPPGRGCRAYRMLTMDHMIPLKRGGDHSALNVVPACYHCNIEKGNATPLEYALFLAGVWHFSVPGRSIRGARLAVA